MKGFKELIKQWLSLIFAGIAAACCLGFPVILAAVGAMGLGFLIRDAYLFPIFVSFVGISLKILYTSSHKHRKLFPFWIGLAGSLMGTITLWLLVTGIYAIPWLIYSGLIILVISSIWDFINGRSHICKVDVVCEVPPTKAKFHITGTHIAKGVGLSVAAATFFYGMYKSVESFGPENKVSTGDISCWGINSCKGQTACATAFNSCTGQNSCKGRGFIYVPAKECSRKGGKPLEQSEGATTSSSKS